MRSGTAGSLGSPARSASQTSRTAVVVGVSGVIRFFRPFPSAADVRSGGEVNVAARRPVSSETRSPVWTASTSSAWSRLPVQVRAVGGVE